VSRIPRGRPSAALVVACVALLIALGGTSFASVEAAVPNNSVGSAQLKSNAVVAAKIASNAVVAAKIAGNAVSSAKIAGNAVTTAKVADGSLVAADFKAGELPETNGFARFLNGPIVVPLASATLATLTIPQAGDYMIWGKAYLTGAANAVDCRLQAGGDFDETQAAPAVGAPAGLAFIVTHTFTDAGSVTLQCNANGAGTNANFIKISAIKLAKVTNGG
jgi:hypothetical protein